MYSKDPSSSKKTKSKGKKLSEIEAKKSKYKFFVACLGKVRVGGSCSIEDDNLISYEHAESEIECYKVRFYYDLNQTNSLSNKIWYKSF